MHRRSFLRSIATAIIGIGVAPKIFLAQTEIEPAEIHVEHTLALSLENIWTDMPLLLEADSALPHLIADNNGRIYFIDSKRWGDVKMGVPRHCFPIESRSKGDIS